MLTKALESEDTQTDDQRSSTPFNIFFELCRHQPIKEKLLSFLGAEDLQKLGLATGVKTPGYQSRDGLFFHYKAHYLKRTRLAQAETLRNLVLAWHYGGIPALVTRDPKVLSIVCDYKMNRWQNDKAIRRLSALEYAWLAGDENFIELFERLGKDQLEPICYQNKERLQAESRQMLGTIAQVFSDYADNLKWDEFEPSWRAAPFWVYGLAYYFYKSKIDTADEANHVNVFSDDFRQVVWRWGWAMNPTKTLRPNLCRCISARIKHAQTALSSESTLTEPPQPIKTYEQASGSIILDPATPW